MITISILVFLVEVVTSDPVSSHDWGRGCIQLLIKYSFMCDVWNRCRFAVNEIKSLVSKCIVKQNFVSFNFTSGRFNHSYDLFLYLFMVFIYLFLS